MEAFKPGQRWISQSEMELGLGRVAAIEGRTVRFDFPAASQQRIYRTNGAPVLRFRLQEGEQVRGEKGETFLIERIEEENGILVYIGKGNKRLPESQLHHRMNAKRDNLFERLVLNQIEPQKHFRLRERIQNLRCRWLSSPVRGMIGPRVDLIPHQYYICHRACSGSGLPRLMLSDEVGLGKTIEAGMIWHALRTRGRVMRTLVLVPESLKHQWIVEMLRRFNQFFTLVDVGYIQSMAAQGDHIENPFNSRNEMLCTFEYLMEEPSLTRDLLKSQWDLVIVDEAHHLVCEGDFKSPQYMLVNAIAGKTKGLLFLTGTPLQLHPEAHFNRLRMLDPGRFSDYESYIKEQDTYKKLVADLKNLIKPGEDPDRQLTWEELGKAIPKKSSIRTWLENVSTHSLEAGEWVRRIVDALGTGSIVFRNSRKGVGGFPARKLHAHPIEPSPVYRSAISKAIAAYPDEAISLGINGLLMKEIPEAWPLDERMVWLGQFLKTMKKEKILLICSDREVVKALNALLPAMIGSENYVLFHEGMDLVARDRAADWFARREGARLLVASEIGSEGRNFQFAHHLVLFDLPLDASLLEQRIGRLDRIGQRDLIHLHVPYAKGSSLETLFTWYSEGLDAFLNPLMGSGEVYLKYEENLLEAVVEPALIDDFRENTLPAVRQDVSRVRKEVEEGRDRLLEYNSRNATMAGELVRDVDHLDADRELHEAVTEALEEFGVDVDEGPFPRSYILRTTPQMRTEIPGLSEKSRIVTSIPIAGDDEGEHDEKYNEIGVTVTTDRHEALDHDAIDFLSWEHPTVQGVFDLVTMEEFGTVTIALWDKAPERGVLMQYDFIHEPVTAPDWGLTDIAGPELLRVLVDSSGNDFSTWFERLDAAKLKSCALPPGPALENKVRQFATDGLSGARKIAQGKSQELVQKSLSAVSERLEREYQRAQYLFTLQGKAEDHPILVEFRRSIVERKKAVQSPQLRLDCIRMLVCR